MLIVVYVENTIIVEYNVLMKGKAPPICQYT